MNVLQISLIQILKYNIIREFILIQMALRVANPEWREEERGREEGN